MGSVPYRSCTAAHICRLGSSSWFRSSCDLSEGCNGAMVACHRVYTPFNCLHRGWHRCRHGSHDRPVKRATIVKELFKVVLADRALPLACCILHFGRIRYIDPHLFKFYIFRRGWHILSDFVSIWTPRSTSCSLGGICIDEGKLSSLLWDLLQPNVQTCPSPPKIARKRYTVGFYASWR